MAITLQNTAEGQADGTHVTAGNSGGGSGNAFDTATENAGSGGSFTFSTTQAGNGTHGYKVSTGATATTVFGQWSTTSITAPATTAYLALDLYMGAFPGATLRVAKFLNTAGAAANFSLDINTSGKVIAKDSAGTTIASMTSSIAVPLNQWFRLEAKCIANAATGQVEYKIFKTNVNSSSPDETRTSAANVNTSTEIQRVQFGNALSLANADLYMDDLGYSDVAYLGPTGTPPAASSDFIGWGIAL